MEENADSFRPPDVSRGRGRPILLIAQLMKQVAGMQHVDEVFLWLAQAMIQHLDITVVQFLAIQRDSAGQLRTELRAAAGQDPSLAQIGYGDDQVAAAAERVFHEQRGTTSRPVESVFPPLQASLFAQQNLRCWAGYFLRSDAFLPPAKTERMPEKTSMPLNVVISLFTLYPLSAEQARAINFILEQALRIVINRRLLSQPASA